MGKHAAIVAVSIVLASAAAAADELPQELTDRPVMNPRGMWALDLSIVTTASLETTTGPGGTTTTTRTRLGDDYQPDLELRRSFGSFELSIDASLPLAAGISVKLGDAPAKVFASFSYLPRIGPNRYFYGEEVGVAYKALLVPRQFALFATLAGGAAELAQDASGSRPASAGVITNVQAGATAELQLSHRVEVGVEPGISITPSNTSMTAAPTQFGIGASFLVALGRWDVSAGASIYDADGIALPSIAGAAELRW